MMKNIFHTLAVILGIISFTIIFVFTCEAQESLSGELVIVGSGDPQDLLKAIATRFEAIHPNVTITIPDSIGSSGGIRAVGKDQAELGRVARPIKENEKEYGLTSRFFAVSPIVFVVNPSVDKIDNLTSEQIVDIYSGKITSWKQLGSTVNKIYPLEREAGDSGREILEQNIPGLGDIETSVAKVFYTDPETIEALQTHNNTIGYAPMAMVNKTSLKILKINGFYPSQEAINNGSYKGVVPFGIVYKGELNPLAKAFIDFLYSPESQTIIMEYGCVPLTKTE